MRSILRTKRLMLLISCGLLLVAAWAAFWWLAVPRHEICAMKLPAPAGCNSVARVPVAAVCTLSTAVLYGVLLLFELRTPRSRWRIPAVLALVIGIVTSHYAVLYA